MQNHVQPGKRIPYTASGSDVASGSVVLIAGLVAVAAVDIADGETENAAIGEVYSIPKDNATAMTAGEKPSWDLSEGKLVTAGSEAAGDVAGAVVVWEDAADTDETVNVFLLESGGTVTP